MDKRESESPCQKKIYAYAGGVGFANWEKRDLFASREEGKGVDAQATLTSQPTNLPPGVFVQGSGHVHRN